MDSLTQLTLGAAVGEVVLGKKVGNRAMVWGAIGGTIPDMDVFANLVTDEISALAFHRAITHSLFFATVTPVLMGWLVSRMETRPPVVWWKSAGLVWLALFLLIGCGSLPMPFSAADAGAIGFSVSTVIMIFPVVVFLLRRLRNRPVEGEPVSWKAWGWLFFWSIVTHPLLDTCTTYGTQLFQPFHNYRAAIDNISVVDPLYTIPFLICLLLASRRQRNHKWRQRLNYLGIGLSSAYMIFTFYNKYRVNEIFEQSLQREGIAYHRLAISPSIFNNILWQGLAEGDTAYYHGLYSILDRKPQVLDFSVIPKRHELLQPYENDRVAGILKWFSNGYYSVLPRADGTLQFNDLRFGALGETFKTDRDFVFRFLLKDENGTLSASQNRDSPPDAGEAFRRLWERIKGI
ncbi:MAG: metal-dependent hydrolase [Saprospiraceae bacterium]|nr:metal-dependent hydrolase [Saprospiraceae bacterium]